jgi:hypothetical protein
MWLWTLKTGDGKGAEYEAADGDSGDEEESGPKKASTRGFALKFDAARKIAQGLGAHLEELGTLVGVSGETARLLPVADRAQALFGKDGGKATPAARSAAPRWNCSNRHRTRGPMTSAGARRRLSMQAQPP